MNPYRLQIVLGAKRADGARALVEYQANMR
jgi:hypothetical protein